jgi:hypothetical protein
VEACPSVVDVIVTASQGPRWVGVLNWGSVAGPVVRKVGAISVVMLVPVL